MNTTARKILGAGSLALAVASCNAPRTQIVVVVDTDLAVPSSVGSLRITVRDPNGGESEVRSISLVGHKDMQCADSVGGTRFCVPLSFLLVPKERRPQDSMVDLTVDGVEGVDALTGRVRVSYHVRIPFAPGRTLRLPVFLSRSCEQILCANGLTCVEDGVCVPVEQALGVTVVDPTTGASTDAPVPGIDASEPIDVRSRRNQRDTGVSDDAAAGFDALDARGMPPMDGGMPDVHTGRDASDTGIADTCPGALMRCGDNCVNLNSSTQHCGRCNNECPSGMRCQSGMCR